MWLAAFWSVGGFAFSARLPNGPIREWKRKARQPTTRHEFKQQAEIRSFLLATPSVSPSRRCCRQPAHATAARTWPLPSPPGRRGGAEGGGPSHLIHADSAACLHDTNRWWAGWTAGVPPPTVRLTPLGPLHCCCEPHSAGTTGSRPAGGSIV